MTLFQFLLKIRIKQSKLTVGLYGIKKINKTDRIYKKKKKKRNCANKNCHNKTVMLCSMTVKYQ